MLTCSTIPEFEGRWQGAQQVAENASNLNAAALTQIESLRPVSYVSAGPWSNDRSIGKPLIV
jgi:hypothetical protein